MHPTHGKSAQRPLLKLPEGEFYLKASYPDAQISKRFSKRLKWFPRYNPWFAVLVMVIYTAMTWGLPDWKGWQGAGQLLNALLFEQGYFVRETAATTWITGILLLLLTWLLAKGQEKPGKPGFRWYGLLHGVCHIGLAWVLYYGLWIAFQSFVGRDAMDAVVPTFLRLGLFAVLSGLLGSLLTGFYFLTSLNWFDKHANDAFAGLRIQDYKSFLRMHITRDGVLEIYPIGIPEPKEHPCEATLELIEPAIRIVPAPLPPAQP